MSTATGAPWQTVNEARKLFNLSPIEGGDEMVRPLNVLFGGQASPQDGGVATGQAAKEAVASFLLRQSAAVCSKRDAGASEWWDPDRWNRELTADLVKAGMTSQVALAVAEGINARAHSEYVAGRSAQPATVSTLEVR